MSCIAILLFYALIAPEVTLGNDTLWVHIENEGVMTRHKDIRLIPCNLERTPTLVAIHPYRFPSRYAELM
jgi:hypothetical protein